MYQKIHNTDGLKNSDGLASDVLRPQSNIGLCCGDNIASLSKDSGAINFGAAIDSVTIDGNVVALATPASTRDDLRNQLHIALKGQGYEDNINTGIRLVDDGAGNLTLDIYGQGLTVSNVAAGATNFPLTHLTTQIYLCEYELTLVGAVGPVINGATTNNLANSPTYTPGDDAANELARAQLETDLAASLAAVGATNLGKVTVLVNNTAQAFDTKFIAASAQNIQFGQTNTWQQTDCYQDFV